MSAATDKIPSQFCIFTGCLKKPLRLLMIAWMLAGCAHSVHLYQADNSVTFQGKLIESTGEQFTVLGFVSETHYVEEAFNKLKAQCQNGRIEGINTRYSTSLGFFSWTNKIRMRGYCVSGLEAANLKTKRKVSSEDQADFADE